MSIKLSRMLTLSAFFLTLSLSISNYAYSADRDADGLNMNKAMILLGHVNSEEAGMEYLASWLNDILVDIPIHFVPAGDPFWTP